MKQTAVEWLVEEMFKQGYLNDKQLTVTNIEHFVEQAKEMEKEQIIKAYENMNSMAMYGEQYYKETFKSE